MFKTFWKANHGQSPGFLEGLGGASWGVWMRLGLRYAELLCWKW